MASRFGDEYRPPHGGDNVFGWRPYQNPNRGDFYSQEYPFGTKNGKWPIAPNPDAQHQENPTLWDTRPMKSPFKSKNDAIYDWRGDGDGKQPPKTGGSKVPSKPKKPSPKGSGGVAKTVPSKQSTVSAY